METIESISAEEWEQLVVDEFTDREAEGFDELPASAFFKAWAAVEAVQLTPSGLVLAPNGIPVSLRPCFQEYTLEKLDPERDAFTIIERTLALGCQPEVQWLFARYGRERVYEWVQQAGSALLSRRRFRLWVNYLDVRNYRPRRRGVWPY